MLRSSYIIDREPSPPRGGLPFDRESPEKSGPGEPCGRRIKMLLILCPNGGLLRCSKPVDALDEDLPILPDVHHA